MPGSKHGGLPQACSWTLLYGRFPLEFLEAGSFTFLPIQMTTFIREPIFLMYSRSGRGGLAIYGALILGAVGVFIGSRQAGIRFLSVADAVAPGILLAQGIGRLGNYFNQELFGLPTTLPWGLEIPSSNPAYPLGLPDGLSFHPTFAYEMIWNLTGVVALIWLGKKLQLQWGKVFALYLIIYSSGRVWIEAIRIDPSEIILGLRINIWSALTGIAIGVVIYLVQTRRHPGKEPSVWLEGREPVDQPPETSKDAAK